MKFNPLKKPPTWLNPDRDISHVKSSRRIHYLRSIRYHFALYRATPKWFNDYHYTQIKKIYKERDRLRKRGEKVVVDHIVPIRSDEVCGLNVPWNYQIINEMDNIKKSNNFWPGKHVEQFEIEIKDEPYQMKLL